MTDRHPFIKHKGKIILFSDLSNLKQDELLDNLKKNEDFDRQLMKEGKKDILLLIDVSNSFTSTEILNELKKSGKELESLYKKIGMVGITGLKKVLLKSVLTIVNANLKLFDDIEAAKDWLISEEE